MASSKLASDDRISRDLPARAESLEEATPTTASATSSMPVLPFTAVLKPYGGSGPTAAQAATLRRGVADGSVLSTLLQQFQQANPGFSATSLTSALSPLLVSQVAALDKQLAAVWAGPRPSNLAVGGTTYATTWAATSPGVGLRISADRFVVGARLLIGAGPAAPVVGVWQSALLRGDGASQVVVGSGLIAGQVITATGRVELGGGSDALLGHGIGIGLVNQGLVDLGPGRDRIVGSGLFTGVANSGRLRLDGDVLPTSSGSQDDDLLGLGAFTGIVNLGRIDASAGTDRVIGAAAGTGVLNGVGARISLGSGRDLLAGGGLGLVAGLLQPGSLATAGLPAVVLQHLADVLAPYATETAPEGGLVNYGTIDTGDQGDIVFVTGGMAAATPETTAIRAFTAQFGPYDGVALVNAAGAELDTGAGDDLVLALGSASGQGPRPVAVANDGLIDLGDGRDVLLAPDGFSGNGLVRLGDGDDALLGFGSGRFDFGSGSDTLGLPAGSYRLRRGARQSLEITRTGDTAVMRTWNLEAINGVRIGSLLSRPDGAFTIGSAADQVPLPSGPAFDIAARMADLNGLLR